MSGGLPGFCTLCGSAEDRCPCEDAAAWHEEIQYHGGDPDELRACDACDRYAEETPTDLEHENGMHADAHIEGCAGCDSRGF